jgi:hypothetical protein
MGFLVVLVDEVCVVDELDRVVVAVVVVVVVVDEVGEAIFTTALENGRFR